MQLRHYLPQLVKTTPILLVFSIFILYIQMRLPLYFHDISNLNQVFLLALLHVITSFIFFFTVPAVASTFIFKLSLKELGVCFPTEKIRSLFFTLIAFLLLVPTFYLMTTYPSIRIFYTLPSQNILEVSGMLLLFPLYYFGEEFFFRGFLFLSLWKKIGWHSFWVTDIIFTLSHLGKPGMEILLCIPASVIFNLLTLYTRSIYPAIFVHSSMGVLCILWVNF